ncbi:ABC transporter ATP-binding protein [Tropicimonas sp. TH_r6]|uniref:ABC transporter ATP-binding protein n=1 Tax=Tropicimonas sp. TH_r6 TaxID=3082085 RepID=UPI002953BBC9|nr:ABC transporter ATP-binding protein [Tropicimonas sp. TH_r6]MDV7141360.1 ABC transporter ATP-binding protein [Tropicimonas sp. TH_r6]
MSRPWQLESFDTADPVASVSMPVSDNLLEDERLQSFDRGYKDGWDDAAKAHAEEQATITAELAGNLQALSFTYHEARSAVLREMEGILKGVVSRVLPGTMERTLGQMIVERVNEAAESAADITAEIVVNPENADRIRILIEGMIAPPVQVREEASLGEGQAYIRLGSSEQKIDLEAVLEGLSDAVAEFFEIPDQMEAVNV